MATKIKVLIKILMLVNDDKLASSFQNLAQYRQMLRGYVSELLDNEPADNTGIECILKHYRLRFDFFPHTDKPFRAELTMKDMEFTNKHHLSIYKSESILELFRIINNLEVK